jgi:hypothetical protein
LRCAALQGRDGLHVLSSVHGGRIWYRIRCETTQ